MTKKTIAERLELIGKEMLELAADLKGAQYEVDCASKAKLKGIEKQYGSQEGLNAELKPTVPEPSSDEQDYERAIEEICKTKTVSIAHFQRKFGWGYNHAAKILGLLKERGKCS